MASISSLGIGSGMDLNSIFDGLQAAEKKQLDVISKQQTSFTAKLSAYGTLKNALETFNSANNTLAAAGIFTATSISSSSPAFSATTGNTTVAAGKYAISVTQLASAQTLTSSKKTDKTSAIASSDSTITIQQANGTQAVSVSITAANASLNGIRDAINAANAGVTASIIQVSSGNYVLSLTANNTGTENAVSNITVTGDTDLQNFLSYDASSSSNALTQSVAAQNAALTVNNVAIDSSSNTLTAAIEGVTLNLSDVTSGNQALTISKNTAAATNAITSWVEAYNTLLDSFASLTKYNAVDLQSKSQNSNNGALLGDSTLRLIQTRLKSLLTNNTSSSAFKTLAQIGITTDPSSGKLELNANTLNNAMASNTNSIKEMIIGDGKTTGIATTISSNLENWLDSNGIIQTATDGVSKTLNDLTTQYNSMSIRIDDKLARLRTEFTHLDVTINKLNQTSSYLTQQFDTSKSGSGSGK